MRTSTRSVIRLLGALALIPLIAAGTTAPVAKPPGGAAAMRWKINTHVFAANVALADAINDGMVTIPPFGELPVAPAALRALREAPAAYRAGVLAPDLFPDMYVGGWFIHSDLSRTEGWIADDWMRHVWSKARAWPNNGDKNKVMAFAYGFLTHGAGDIFAHTWVNEKADGAWVSFTGKDKSTAFKHVVLEGYVGEHTPATDFSLDVWPRFVSNVLIKDPLARQHSKGATHYRRWLAIYDALPPLIARAEREMNNNVDNDAPYWVKCTANPVACARKEQMETWRLDINRGLRALVDSSESLGERLMEGSTGDGIHAMTGWSSEWLPKMYGVHALGEGTAAVSEFMEWAGNLVPIDAMIKAEVERFMEETLPDVWELYKAAKQPSYWMEQPGFFEPGTKNAVNQEMGVAPGAATFNWRAFKPLYNTVILSKLALLDAAGLNELARRAGVGAPIVPSSDSVNIMLGVFLSMTQSFQWKGELVKTETRFGICGPETGDTLPHVAYCGLATRAAPKGLAVQTPPRAVAPRGSTRGIAGQATPRIAAPQGTPRGAVSQVSVQPSTAGAPLAREGFVLWGNPEAREKVFNAIFKGDGTGPGAAEERALGALALPGVAPGTTDTRRALRSAMDQVEYMRELVVTMRGKTGGVTRGTDATNWGDRCCSTDIAALRAALSSLNATSSRLVNPMLLSRLGRRPSITQLGARAAQANAAVTAFASARDAASATAALVNLSRHIESLAAVVAGTQ